ncbi:hypothetical protein CN884_02095 [Ochrobactrum sp. 30A/1000/2015]|nr:hypothetical protein CN884_02095 [Ochrobactrum sp. 30A/1000/2015]PJT38635.1 hypothetical protein CN883_12710 [Ochrobactrum sp. 27A/999/2015]PJT44651.1 hypothetical protein CN882_02095 [Ochrobactrum sp. 23A/997/2015]
MITREELYELVWSKPMLRVAEQFEVSSSYMARVCSALNVPRPERGYWAKMAVGKAPPQAPLPDARPGDLLSWSRDGELPVRPKPAYVPEIRKRAPRQRVSREAIHGLIWGARAHFESGRPVDEETYLKPYKKLLLDVITSKACLDKSLDFANELFKRLEASGDRVMIAPTNEKFSRARIDERETSQRPRDYYHSGLWSPYRPTIVYIGTIAVGLTIVEASEKVLMRHIGNGKYIREADYIPPRRSRYAADHTWTTTKEIPSGRLKLVIYSPYHSVTWLEEWLETSKSSLSGRIPEIVRRIEKAAEELVPKLQKADRQAEIRHQEWLAAVERSQREEDRRKVEQSVKDSREDLAQIMERWSHVISVEQFLTGVARRADELDQDRRQQVLERLNMARDFLGTQDPLDFFMSWRTPDERYSPKYTEAQNN